MMHQELIDDFLFKVNSKFKGLTFKEKSHEYFVNEKKVPISVSGIIKSFISVTDWDAIATAIAKRDGLTKEQVVKSWRDKNTKACASGSKTHDFAENLTENSVAENLKEQAVINFWKKLEKENPGRYFLIAKEVRMYHKLYNFSGTCDFVLFDALLNGYIIGDYKTNEDLFKNYKEQTLIEPFEFLLDCPYNHYQIQLSLYEILLEQIEIPIFERWIIYLRDDSNHNIYKTHDFSVHLKSEVLEKKYNTEFNMSI